MKTLGLGGVFLRMQNVDKMIEWYREVLKIEFLDWNGAIFLPAQESCTIFSFFSEENDYFPLNQRVMLNFQVDDMEEFLKHIQDLKIEIIKEPEKSEFGHFVWIKDPEGNLIEVWQREEL